MKRLLNTCAVALAFALVLGASQAFADGMEAKTPPGKAPLRAELHISNGNTGEGGTDVSGSTGDEVTFKLRVKNNRSQTATVTVSLSAGIPGCMIQEDQVVVLAPHKQAKEIVIGLVPADESGVLAIDVSATSDLGDVAVDHAQLSFNLGAKAEGAVHGGRQGIWQQILVRTLANRMLAGLANDGETKPNAQTSISRFKNIYR